MRKDGTTSWLLLSGKSIDPNKPADLSQGVIWSFIDINKRKKAEQAVISEKANTENRYRTLFNNIQDGVCIHSFSPNNTPTNFLEVNDAMTTIFGYTKDELLKMTPADLHSESTLKDLKGFADTLHRNKSLTFESILKDKDGNLIYCELLSSIIEIDVEPVVLTSIKNVTDRKKQDETIKAKDMLIVQQSKLSSLGEMLGAISHQWKQPLNQINLLAELTSTSLDEKDSQTDVKGYIQDIQKNVIFMADTLNAFRDFFLPSKDQKNFSISRIIYELIDLLGSHFKMLDIKVDKDVSVNDQIMGNPSEFKQVIMNLLNNTNDALLERSLEADFNTEISGNILINITKVDNKITITYSDNAGGIPEDVASNMFAPYNTSKGDKGTGIGMYLSYQIIRSMGGEMKFKNNSNGSEFKITI